MEARRPLIRRPGPPPAETTAPEDGGLYFSSPKPSNFIHSGCTVLDCVLGGGWACDRVVNIIGDKSTGKTLLAMEATANFARQYPQGQAKYREREGAFDIPYARALGIPFDRVDFKEDMDTVEKYYAELEACANDKSGHPKLLVLDSLDSISTDAEQERKITDDSYGDGKAKMLSEVFRRLATRLNKSNTCPMVISQVRDNIGATMFQPKNTRSGGRALDFYASQIVWLAHMKTLTRQVNKIERAVGIRVKAKCSKNKVGLPFRECEFEITFGYGIEDEKASREFLKAAGVTAGADSTKIEHLPKDLLDALVIKTWYDIERTFLPTVKKY